jgi:Holliday junction resolvase RusA-like endonuclease
MKPGRTDPDDLRTSAFRVLGHPVPQSGMKPVSTAAGPRLVTTGGRDLENWRHSLAAEAAVARVNGRRHLGPVALCVEFRYPMPGARTAAQRHQDSIPKVTQPDLDKLLRAVCDGMTAGALILDDAQICEIHATKSEWGDSWTGCDIQIRDLWMP